MLTNHESKLLPGTLDPADWSCGVVTYACPVDDDAAALKFLIADDRGNAITYTVSINVDQPSVLDLGRVTWFKRTLQTIIEQAQKALDHAERVERTMNERRAELRGEL